MDTYKTLRKSDFFRSLNDSEIEYILDNSVTRDISKGSIIHTSHEVCENITVILEGKVYSSSYSLNGNEQIICSFSECMVFGFPVVFGEMTYPENITAETDCRLLYISRSAILNLFDNKEFLMDFIKRLALKVKDLSQVIETLSYTSVKERVAKYLLKCAQVTDSNQIQLDKNKTRLAKELATSRVVVSRTFKLMEDEGIIKRNDDKHITILDIEALKLFS